MSRLSEILQRKNARKARLQASLESIVVQLGRLGALKVILFGSFARGEADIDSDLDLLVVMPPTRTGKEWMDLIYTNVERNVASDIIVYNLEEFEEKLPTSSFLQHLAGGKMVYEKTA